MALRYYMDVHVPSVITESLRRRGIEVLTSQEDGTREAHDENLLQRATDLGRILFSQDADLLRIANEWQSQGRSFAGVVFAHQQRTGIGPLVVNRVVWSGLLVLGHLGILSLLLADVGSWDLPPTSCSWLGGW